MGVGVALCALAPALAQTGPPPSRPGQVLFSRSTGNAAAPGSVAVPAGAAAQSPAETAPATLAVAITDALRRAPVFTRYDFTLHLAAPEAGLEAELRTSVRNSSLVPLAILPLQLSSTLHFEHVRAGSQLLRFAVHTVASDTDHTGELTEAAVELPAPLAPGASIDLVIDYGGMVAQSSARLDQLGAPALDALRSDWDRIGPDFTGLRGFGDVIWYPVSSVPTTFASGDQLFHEIARQKAQDLDAPVSMDVTEEFHGDAPNVAVLDGMVAPAPAVLTLPTASFAGVARWVLPPTPIGFAVPSLVLATRADGGSNAQVAVAALPSHTAAGASWVGAGSLLAPLFDDWLGAKPHHPLLLVDLPVDGADPAEEGDALLLSLAAPLADPAAALAAPLTLAYFRSPRPWLQEGVPELMAVLWAERQAGAQQALELLNRDHAALAFVEPGTPGESAGEPLLTACDLVYVRTKATYVLWMLRSLVGDAALSATLRAYDAGRDTSPTYFEDLLEHTLATPSAIPPGSLPSLTQPVLGANSQDLHWFFENWVYQDPGLPDLSIQNVYSSHAGSTGDQWLVAVTIANNGYAEAQVPVTVHSAGAQATVAIRVPARSSIARRIVIEGTPTEVDVNNGSVPEVADSIHRRILQ